jgi:hypothetical protein
MSGPSNYVPTITNKDPPVPAGAYLAEVIGHLDKTSMGILEVKLHRPVGNSNVKGQTYPAKYMSPFYGVTPQSTTSANDDYENTQKSYGMWAVPPDVGSTVIVMFIQGDPKYGYWIGCVPDEGMNFMTPGIAATRQVVEDTKTVDDADRLPVAEYNKKVNSGNQPDPTKIKKAQHPLAEVLSLQGLIKDDTRGITTSSARREVPSMVFGISTPGPLDKAGPAGFAGPEDDPVAIPTNRLGGSTFVMDDGDDKFLRKISADSGPPVYARTENNETNGDPKIPHNELVRIRTRTGHQILLHNSEDLIYIGNAKGTTWIELTSNGKIDIFADDSISIHTNNDLNIRAERDINLEAGRNINFKAADVAHIEANSIETVATTTTKITSGTTSHINSKTNHLETAKKIYMNSKQAAEAAEPLKTIQVPTELGETIEAIMARVPMHEPWPHHENLDPNAFTPNKTDRDAGTYTMIPELWKSYSTLNDTFDKLLPPNSTSTPSGGFTI